MSVAYSFFPWVRDGLAQFLARGDGGSGRATVEAEVRVGRSTVPASVKRKLALAGPGEVLGIDPRQVIRTAPPPSSTTFEPNYLPFVDLDEPALPFLFSPDLTPPEGGPHRLFPWVCLVVTRQDRSWLDAKAQPLPVLMLEKSAIGELPDLKDAWAWVHAQVVTGTESVDEALADRPAQTLSRLLCPRRLDPRTAYHACVVPTFKAGRDAGLDKPAVPSRTLAWGEVAEDEERIRLPVYYHWEFTTGEAGDFGTLSARLRPQALRREVGVRSIDMSQAGIGTTVLPPLEVEGALRAPAGRAKDWPPRIDVERALERLLESAPGPSRALLPPIYGGAHAPAAGKLPDLGQSPAWLRELNLDPRHRVAAMYGARVIRDQQEQLAASAWEQAGDLGRVNRTLAEAQLARAVAESIVEKRLEPLGPDTLLQVTEPAHARIESDDAEPTVRLHVRGTVFPESAATPPFRRTRSGGPIGRRLANARTGVSAEGPGSLIDRLAAGHLRPKPIVEPPGTIFFDAVSASAGKAARWAQATPQEVDERAIGWKFVRQLREFSPTPLRTSPAVPEAMDAEGLRPVRAHPEARRQPGEGVDPRPGLDDRDIGEVDDEAIARMVWMRARFRAAAADHQDYVRGPAPSLAAASAAPLNLSGVKAQLVRPGGKLDPTVTIPERVRPRVANSSSRSAGIGAREGSDPLQPVLAGPRFPQPMVEPLRATALEAILPGLERVPRECVGLLEPNAHFVESFMVGANDELAQELRWRGFPADERATSFDRFWDVRGRGPTGAPDADIGPIAGWQNPLGRNVLRAPGRAMLVVLLRGELVRRSPNLILYAVRARDRNTLGEGELYPDFRTQLASDLVVAGFGELTAEAAGGTPTDPGWFIVLQEQPTEPRFGLDPATRSSVFGATPTSWSTLSWAHFAASWDQLQALTHLPARPRFANAPLEGLRWGEDASHIARITLREPVRVAVHASKMLPKATGR